MNTPTSTRDNSVRNHTKKQTIMRYAVISAASLIALGFILLAGLAGLGLIAVGFPMMTGALKG